MGTLLASANEEGRSPEAAQVLKFLKNTCWLWISSSSCTQNNHIQIEMAHIDDRGHEKAELVMFDPQAPNFQNTVNLVPREAAPRGFQLVDPDKSGKKNQFDLVELAANIQTADQFTRATAGSKLTVIAEQVRFLQQQAKAVLEEANLNKELHHIACNFKKVPGKIYYVYKREDSGAKYMSMISPEEWGENCPIFDAAYKLEHDMTFTPYDKIERRSNDEVIIDKILKINSNQLSLGFC